MFAHFTTLLALAPLCSATAAFAADSRVALLERSLLAPCCYKEPVSRHQSEVSTKMKLEIARWVGEGKSDAEILNIYRARYGDRVVTAPEKEPRGGFRDFPGWPGWPEPGLWCNCFGSGCEKGWPRVMVL